jgi:hypothetical protein
MENKWKLFSKLFTVAALLLVAAALYIFFNGVFQPGKILFGSDFLTIYLPFRIFADSMFHNFHQLPLWMPHLFFGFPLIASSSLLYYYPTDLIFMLLNLPPQFMGTFDVALHMAVAFFGMFLFLRQLGIRKEAAFFSSFAFMLSGFMVSYINVGHWNNIKAGALIPFVFYFVLRGADNKKLLPFLNAAIFLALQILATGMQIMAYTLFGALLLAVYRIFSEKEASYRGRLIIYIATALLFTFLFSALQLVESIPYTDFSWRGDFNYQAFISWSLHPLESLTLILPNLFGFTGDTYYGAMNFNMTTYYFGGLSLITASFAFFRGKSRGTAIFAACAAALFLILSWGGFTPVYGIFYHVPVFKQFRTPSRFMYIFTFFMCMLSAIGLENIMAAAEQKQKELPPYFKIAAAAFAVFSVILIIISVTGLEPLVSSIYRGFKNATAPARVISLVEPLLTQDIIFFAAAAALFFATAFLLLKGKVKNFAAAALVLAAFNLVDMHRIDKKFIFFVDYGNFVPAVDPMVSAIKNDNDLVRSTDFAFDWGAPNRNIYYDMEGLNGMHGLMPGKFVKMKNDGVFNFLGNDRYFNVKYYITKQELNVKGLAKIYDDGRKVFMDSACAPRFDFNDRVIKLPGDAEIYNLMKSGTFDYKTVLVKDDVALTPSDALLSYKIGLTMYSPNRIKMRLTCSKDGILVIKNGYYPAWKVKVDKRPERIYNVDYCFMGIPVKAGEHDLDIYYGSGGFYAGLMLTLLGLAGYVAVFILERRKKEKVVKK